MGNRSIKLALLSVLVAATASAELDFTPTVEEYEGDGVKFKQLVFSDGSGKKITYTPPAGWDYSGGAARFNLRPPGKPQAEASVTKVALPKAGAFDEESMKKIAEEALASVPKGSTDVKLVEQEKNPVVIDGKETFLVKTAYTFHGEAFGRSIMFLNRGTEQIRFQFVSRQVDFAGLQRAFLGSHFSWQGL